MLLRAWRRLGFHADEARLLVVGSSTVHARCRRLSGRVGKLATDSVHFIAGRRNVVTPLHASDVVVVPSVWREPFGRTVIEALATGRPVVASRVGGIPEILTGPLDRFLFEPADPEALAEQLRSLRNWRERQPGLAGQCRAHIVERFTLAHTVEGLEASFRSAR